MDGDDLQACYDLGLISGLIAREEGMSLVSAVPEDLTVDVTIGGRRYTLQITDAEVVG